MFEFFGMLIYIAASASLIIGLIFLGIAVILVVGGILGIALGTTTAVETFGITLVSAVLGESAIKIGIIIGFIAFLFLFMSFVLFMIWAKLLPWLREVLNTSTNTGFISSGFPAPPFQLPNGINLPGLPSGLNFLEIFLLPADQRAKLPAHILCFLEAFQKCACNCKSEKKDPFPEGVSPVDVSLTILADLHQQLENARKKLEEAGKDKSNWEEKIKDLTKKIAEQA